MPPPPILDLTQLDLSNVVADRPAILQVNPQRHEFALLDAVVLLDAARGLIAGYHDVRPDAFWVRGHIPGRPLFPGVLMIEVAAQLASFAAHRYLKHDRFIGFAGVDQAKFRGTVTPPARFVVLGRQVELKPRRIIMATQGYVDGVIVFEAEITGMTV
jgi:3-hydroxyacyl-[acyl-carrier-protein] dehydratase